MKLYYGVVENNADPEFLGRCQVRIVGKHTENRLDPTQQDYMPVVDLPWAQTLQKGTVISNESSEFSVPANGTVVIISFMDAEEQLPIIMGSVPKLPETLPDFTQGFSDPTGVNPTAESLGKSPISNYATGDPEPLPVTTKKADIEVGITCVDKVWNEPVTPFDPAYPNNVVIQSGQNVLELDNTPTKERVNLQHKSGTFKEMHPNGDEVKKIQGTEYHVVDGNRNLLVKGGSNITIQSVASDFNVDSQLSGINLKAKTDASIEAIGNCELKGTISVTVDTDGVLQINAATGVISIDGILVVTAGIISLN